MTYYQRPHMRHAVRKDAAAASGLRLTIGLIVAGGLVPSGLWLADKFIMGLASLLGLL